MTYSIICKLLNGNDGEMYQHLVVCVGTDLGSHFLKIILNKNRWYMPILDRDRKMHDFHRFFSVSLIYALNFPKKMGVCLTYVFFLI